MAGIRRNFSTEQHAKSKHKLLNEWFNNRGNNKQTLKQKLWQHFMPVKLGHNKLSCFKYNVQEDRGGGASIL
jgi:hypothetical protein